MCLDTHKIGYTIDKVKLTAPFRALVQGMDVTKIAPSEDDDLVEDLPFELLGDLNGNYPPHAHRCACCHVLPSQVTNQRHRDGGRDQDQAL